MTTNQPPLFPDLTSVTLGRGSHRLREDGVCAMEMVAWMAGEKHSSCPECACPALTAFTIRLNDTDWPGGAAQRTKVLGPVLPLLVGSRSTEAVYRRRGYYLSDRMVRELVPMALEARAVNRQPVAAAVFRDVATKLRMLPAIVDMASADVAGRVARDLSDNLSKRRAAVADDASVAAYAVAAVAAYGAKVAAAEAATAVSYVYAVASDAAAHAAAAVAATAGNYVNEDTSLPVLRRAAEILAEAARITEVQS